jgi:hypothetical protein
VTNETPEHLKWRGVLAATLSRPQANGSKMASGPGVPQGHLPPWVSIFTDQQDVASVRETLGRLEHTHYLCLQHQASFVAPLGLLHQQCVHDGAVQLRTAL